MITKDKLQKLTIKGQRDAEKKAAKEEKANKKYDEKLLKKFKQWLEYMITEIAKGGGRKATLPLNPERWDFKNLNALDQATKFLDENKLVYTIDDDKKTSLRPGIPVIIIEW